MRLRNTQQADEAISAGGLYPPLFNVAPRASITVNATCGQNGAEEYCKLVDAYPHRNWAKHCGTCNAHSSDRAKQRPIESLISSSSSFEESWWQSPTLQGGRQFEYVTITLDLKQVSAAAGSQMRLGHSLITCDSRAVIQFVIKPLTCHSFTSDLTPSSMIHPSNHPTTFPGACRRSLDAVRMKYDRSGRRSSLEPVNRYYILMLKMANVNLL